jgi:hypothetical protein
LPVNTRSGDDESGATATRTLACCTLAGCALICCTFGGERLPFWRACPPAGAAATSAATTNAIDAMWIDGRKAAPIVQVVCSPS